MKVENLHKLVFFLLWAEKHDPKMMWGGHTISEAMDALADLMGVSADVLRKELL